MFFAGGISPPHYYSFPPGEKVPSKGADEGTMINRFLVGRDDSARHLAGVSPCGASSFSAWKRNQKTLGDGSG